ncbi:cytochrome P450 [Nocardia terpenica]|uniref:cytochrome P450 n=1 Tax=Nocardia terpenica TaxID=455432 RepID=UPI001895BFAF|nr:cytochrome P450 [Nocardia terpenica]MBF6064103.1 cytochrome P450 [Nocardia terpenica]MBF6107661.1 cytochrome P450 [Nocardia terpenica]MBF6114729.1 cytochrome P450 [Nocardia terpenica]MBF6121284.1 cytochrome P450 [Nocardia terpenica]MBF6153174.1 cytochrome P450 [Nocardia terpenica]
MTVHTEVRHYPFGEPIRLDMDPIYARLRREEPVSRIRLPYGGDGWLVTRYEDAKLVLADPRFSRAVTVDREDIPRTSPRPTPPDGLLSMDPPEHRRVRRLVAKAFTGRRVEQLRPRAQAIVNERLDAIENAGPPADLVQGLALPLPVTVICEMLGVPTRDQHRFRDFSDAVLSTTAYTREEIDTARVHLEDYLAELIAQRRAEPTDDLLGALVAARDNEDRLTESELVSLGVGLLIAGHETTANQIANFTYLLLTQRDQWELLRARPDLVPGAVEELLRYVQLGSGGGFARVAMEDVVLSGVTVRAGESVFVNTQAANRDERIFDRSEELVLTRENNPHMAFGHGVHHCLGAQLARVELQVALGTLLHRFPTLRLAVPLEEVPWKTGLLVRGPKSLPVSW